MTNYLLHMWSFEQEAKDILSSEKFVNEDAERPKVGGGIVTSVEDDLWSHVLWSTTKCPRPSTDSNFLGKPKIDLRTK